MQRHWILTGLPAILVFIIWLCQPVWGKSQTPAEGEQLPEFSLPVPIDSNHQKYLGLSDQQEFLIPAVDAEVVIIDIFSMY